MNSFSITLTILVLVSSVGLADPGKPKMRKVQPPRSPLVCPELKETDLSFAALKNLIQHPGCQIKSISDVLAKLPRGYRSRFSAFYRSRSLQAPHSNDYLNPRVILFGTNWIPIGPHQNKTYLVMSFNGKPGQRGYNGLEMAEIRLNSVQQLQLEAGNQLGRLNDLDVFRYYEIKFPIKDEQVSKYSWQDIQRRIEYSPANPPRCVKCHGETARPIFPGYPVWEGAFGSLHGGQDKVPRAEILGMRAFLKHAKSKKNSRYAQLDWTEYDSVPVEVKRSHPDQLYSFFSRANESLNHRLGIPNGVRVARLIRRTPDYEKFKSAYLGAFFNCDQFPEFIPSPLRKDLEFNLETRFDLSKKWSEAAVGNFLKKIYDYKGGHFGLAEIVYGENLPYPQYLELVQEKIGGTPEYLRLQLDTIREQGIKRGALESAKLRLLTEGQGLDISSWFLDLAQPTYRFQDGGSAERSTLTELISWEAAPTEAMKSILDVFTRMADPNREDRAKEICQALKNESLHTLEQVRVAPLVYAESPVELSEYPKAFSNSCVQCHDSGLSIAPSIPFGTPSKMEGWLALAANRALIRSKLLTEDETIRMPPTRRLSPSELAEIIKFVDLPR